MLFKRESGLSVGPALGGLLVAIASGAADQPAQAAGIVNFGSFAPGTFRASSEVAIRALKFGEEQKLYNKLDLGLNFDWPDPGGHDWSTPFQFEHDVSDDSWRFYLQGSGFEHDVPASGSTRSGFNDVTAIAIYPVAYADAWTLLAGGSVTIPTHGEVGSSSATEAGRLVFESKPSDHWQMIVIGAEGYVNSVPNGVGRRASFVHGELHYVFQKDGDEDVFVALERSVRGGADNTSNAIAAYDFPLPQSWGALKSGTLALIRGLTLPRGTAIEVDLEWRF